MAHEGFHEASALLDETTIDRHRAIESLIEEFEAIDWYDQRARATGDPDLASVLMHNRDDEKEHAAIALEWIRRRDPALDAQLRLYLFTAGPLVSVEDVADTGTDTIPPGPGTGLGIGSLRGVS
jgi:ferritin-like protein